MKLKSNKDYLILAVAFLLIILFVLLAIYFTQRELGGPKLPAGEISTPAQTVPRIKYKPGTLGRAFDKLVNRVPLSPADQAAKERILAPFNGSSGIIRKTDDYVIEYVKSMDDFEIEILTTNIEDVKRVAEAYLKSQGFSNEGLCNLPVRFYLNYELREKLPSSVIFNPLPQGC